MSVLSGKAIVAGICGGIAAYKAAGVVSRLCQGGADVRVVMTRSARRFVAPLTYEALTRRRVLVDLFRDEPLAHIELAYRADLIVAIPATYDIVGKIVNGIADDYLSTMIAASRAPVLFVPAMESQMYENPIFQRNRAELESLGYRFLEPDTGRLASGREGPGRLPAEESIIESIRRILREGSLLQGWRVLATAGPTRERIDPMRCITNRSSGKMGYALAEAARDLGADEVTLISGPTQLPAPSGVRTIRVESAEEMRQSVLQERPSHDVLLMAAAVADWRPKQASEEKAARRVRGKLTLELEPTPDILGALAESLKGEKQRPLVVGFAAESGDLVKNARKKLEQKRLDLVVANEIAHPGFGPESDLNRGVLIYPDGESVELEEMPKRELAREILKRVAQGRRE